MSGHDLKGYERLYGIGKYAPMSTRHSEENFQLCPQKEAAKTWYVYITPVYSWVKLTGVKLTVGAKFGGKLVDEKGLPIGVRGESLLNVEY